uniref:Uncharacterized protein n=1 Tax=Sus scrofa TaxID=9823 RepID=A0A8D1FL23_PIG
MARQPWLGRELLGARRGGPGPSYRALGQRGCDLLDVVHRVDPQGDQGLRDVLADLGPQLPPGFWLHGHGQGLLVLRAQVSREKERRLRPQGSASAQPWQHLEPHLTARMPRRGGGGAGEGRKRTAERLLGPPGTGPGEQGAPRAPTSLRTVMRASEYSMTCWGSACRSSPGSMVSVRPYSQAVRSGGRPGGSPGGSGRVMARDLRAEVVGEQVGIPSPPQPGTARTGPGLPVEGDHGGAQLVLHNHRQAHREVRRKAGWQHGPIGGEAALVDAELLAVAPATAPQQQGVEQRGARILSILPAWGPPQCQQGPRVPPATGPQGHTHPHTRSAPWS